MAKNIAISILSILLLHGISYSQQIEEQVEIKFNLNGYALESEVDIDQESLQPLNDLIHRLNSDTLSSIISITIDSYASPDGGRSYNQSLSDRRADSMRTYLREKLSIDDSFIEVSSNGIAWDQLRDIVASSDMEYRDEVLDILDNEPVETWERVAPTDRWLTMTDSRNKQLMELRGGRPYTYMQQHLFSELRLGSIITLYLRKEPKPEPEQRPEPKPEPKRPESAPELQAVEPIPLNTEKRDLRFALKTNLLYDLALVPNIGFEVPVGNYWSVSGEWIFPWWTSSDNGNALQIMAGQVEGRYWFGDRTDRPQLTGWFAGLYAGGGLYDLQWDGDGYQGEFFIASGLSGGYAHTINKSGSLRMEYSLGVGYLKTNYRYYEGMENNEFLVWQHDGNYTWVGPTKIEVGLVWFINWQRGQ